MSPSKGSGTKWMKLEPSFKGYYRPYSKTCTYPFKFKDFLKYSAIKSFRKTKCHLFSQEPVLETLPQWYAGLWETLGNCYSLNKQRIQHPASSPLTLFWHQVPKMLVLDASFIGQCLFNLFNKFVCSKFNIRIGSSAKGSYIHNIIKCL